MTQLQQQQHAMSNATHRYTDTHTQTKYETEGG